MKTNQIIRNCIAICAANQREHDKRETQIALHDILSPSQIDSIHKHENDEYNEIVVFFLSMETD